MILLLSLIVGDLTSAFQARLTGQVFRSGWHSPRATVDPQWQESYIKVLERLVEAERKVAEVALEAKNEVVEAKNVALEAKNEVVEAKNEVVEAERKVVEVKNELIMAKDEVMMLGKENNLLIHQRDAYMDELKALDLRKVTETVVMDSGGTNIKDQISNFFAKNGTLVSKMLQEKSISKKAKQTAAWKLSQSESKAIAEYFYTNIYCAMSGYVHEQTTPYGKSIVLQLPSSFSQDVTFALYYVFKSAKYSVSIPKDNPQPACVS
eukprot:CAMPEP_0197341094 /NCGR_PEP_ID=MMETSP0892-20130614/46065_1 /TAXON_ID=44058 ORGANISM="Aureoumbra lagunensis, Strain CCMP1510" /NCGR_SAMPLE_ID=MMETSP0892 /ASSEMBLY_ACC=CAM_ASM_000538 /LENGTH=264 /DNA_ID=CAMNT_0042845973 /DNA_START=85 /DNA_END=879 /DNA_ORIENTATION=-